MRIILKDSWKLEMAAKIFDPDFEYRTALPVAARWLIMQLSQKALPFRLVNLGAGVKLITRKTDICPKCKGTGRI